MRVARVRMKPEELENSGCHFVTGDLHIAQHHQFANVYPVQAASLNHNARLHNIQSALETVSRYIRTSGKTYNNALTVCGDIFDSSKPDAHSVYVATKAFKAGSTALLVGNHDHITDDFSAIMPLHQIPQICVFTEPQLFALHDRCVALAIPYTVHQTNAHLFRTIREQIADNPNIRAIMMHVGLSDETTPPWLQNNRSVDVLALASILSECPNVRSVFAGEFHNEKHWEFDFPNQNRKLRIVQVGALVPKTFDDTDCGFIHAVGREGIYVGSVEVPGFRFHTLHADYFADTIEKADELLNHSLNLVRIVGKRSAMANYAEWRAGLPDAKSLRLRLDPREEGVLAGVEQLKASLREMTNIEAMINKFIVEYPFGATVSREEIKQCVLESLAK